MAGAAANIAAANGRGATTVPDDIPRFVTYTSPVSTTPNQTNGALTLPLNLVALIVSLLDDLGDLARVTRTCRLLYYMALPQLYTKVSLHSYPTIRYSQGRPEGFGSGSPFMMALNGLVTKPHASMVQEFRVHGEWNEVGAEDFAKGRVPDNSMMLNILLRAATDKMAKLQSFSWELDCKPLKTLYQGLSAHSTLTSLKIRFPQTRIPRPAVIIPPMANLRLFWAMEIDPLCYPDDISVLMHSSRKLEDLRLHFSPRMRQEAESSLSWENYFGRSVRAERQLKLKHFAVQNFYGRNMEGIDKVLDQDYCNSICFLDFFGGAKGASANVFMDDTWRNIPPDLVTSFKTVRSNEPATQHAQMMSSVKEPLENLYMISKRTSQTGHTPPDGVVTNGPLPVTPDEPTEMNSIELAKQYIYAITRFHGKSMKRLLLWDSWHLTPEDLGDLVRYCPNLEQLGFGVNSEDSLRVMHLLLPFLSKLKVLRLLLTDDVAKQCTNNGHMDEMERHFARLRPNRLKWLSVGKYICKLGDNFEEIAKDGSIVEKVHVEEVGPEAVAHLDIWKLDCLDIFVDPVAPFDP